jgi:hypothetical protein
MAASPASSTRAGTRLLDLVPAALPSSPSGLLVSDANVYFPANDATRPGGRGAQGDAEPRRLRRARDHRQAGTTRRRGSWRAGGLPGPGAGNCRREWP